MSEGRHVILEFLLLMFGFLCALTVQRWMKAMQQLLTEEGPENHPFNTDYQPITGVPTAESRPEPRRMNPSLSDEHR